MLRNITSFCISMTAALYGVPASAQDAAPPGDVTRLARPMFMMPTGTGRSLLDVISRNDVQNELKLDLRQRNTVGELTQAKGGPVRIQARVESSSDASPEEQIKKQLDAQFGGIEGKLKELLKPEQFDRLLALDVQWRGPVALGDPKVADRAQLTPAHRREITEIVSAYQRERMQIIFDNSQVNQSGDGTNRVALAVKAPDLSNPLSPVRKKLDPLKKETEEKILRILDSGERERWNALQGERFTFRSDDPKGARSRY